MPDIFTILATDARADVERICAEWEARVSHEQPSSRPYHPSVSVMVILLLSLGLWVVTWSLLAYLGSL